MDIPTYVAQASQASIDVNRDRRSQIIGRLERQRLTGKTIARDANEVVIGTYDYRADNTHDARGVIVGTDNLLPTLRFRP